jgi:glycosyltransferase involved in cell wall biosynthesis
MITGHFLDADLPVVDGVVRTARAYRKVMDRKLGPSWLVVPRQPGADIAEERRICFPSIPFRDPYRLGVPALDPTLRGRLDAVPFQVVHTHSPFAAGKLARVTASRRRVPLIFTLHSRYPEWSVARYKESPSSLSVLALVTPPRYLRAHRISLRDLREATDAGIGYIRAATQRLVWIFVADVKCTLVASDASARELLAYRDACDMEDRGKSLPRIEVLRQGIDFPERAPGDLRVRERHAIPRGVPLFLFVGQLAPEKNLRFLLDALARLARRGQPFRLLLVGEGPFRADFERHARELAIAERCTFVGVEHDKGRLADYYAQSDLFLFPSMYETQGLAAMEAASFGIPTVGRAGAPGLTEVFRDGVSGSFAASTPESYADAVLALVRDPAQACALGEAARSAVERVDRAVGKVIDVYHDVLCTRAPQRQHALAES